MSQAFNKHKSLKVAFELKKKKTEFVWKKQAKIAKNFKFLSLGLGINTQAHTLTWPPFPHISSLVNLFNL